jgi:CubicO group peptidase (beta-lactamase class C family)
MTTTKNSPTGETADREIITTRPVDEREELNMSTAGMAVDIRRNEIFHTPGRFGWTGGFGTSAYTDPAEGMIGILFTQRMMDSPEPPKVFTDFWTLAYGAKG